MTVVWVLVGVVLLLFGLTAFTGAPYVPTKPRDIKKLFTDTYPLTERDMLVDIGSGDGVVLRAAARQGARAVGYEINPLLVIVSRLLAIKSPNVRTRFANYWNTKFPDDVTVVYTFGESRDIKKMVEKARDEATRLERSIAFISYAFEVPDETPVATSGMHFIYHIDPLHR